MRVAILNLTGGGMCGGYRKYLSEMLPRLCMRDEVNSVLCATPSAVGIEGWIASNHKMMFVPCSPVGPLSMFPDIGLRSSLKAFKPDVVFIPTERRFLFGSAPVVNMVYNMVPLVGSGRPSLKAWARNQYQRYDAEKAFRSSCRLVAVSEYVRSVLKSKYDVSDDKIDVIYFGSDEFLDQDMTPPPCFSEGRIGQFLFTAGSFEDYRGYEDALGALKLLKKTIPNVCLVVAGTARRAMNHYRMVLEAMSAELGLESNVIWAGSLNAHEMSWCYRHCYAFLMTSRLESFGLINVEALAHGCLCVSTTSACMPEIYGDAASYYHPGDVRSLADAIVRIDGLDEVSRGQLRRRAMLRAKYFSWDSAVDRLVRLLITCSEHH